MAKAPANGAWPRHDLMNGAWSPACFFCCLIDFFSLAVCCAFFLFCFGG